MNKQSKNRDRQATIDAYIQAYNDGAYKLARNIEAANSGVNCQANWVPIDFEALRNSIESFD